MIYHSAEWQQYKCQLRRQGVREIRQLSLCLIKMSLTFNGHIALEKGFLITRLQKKIASWIVWIEILPSPCVFFPDLFFVLLIKPLWQIQLVVFLSIPILWPSLLAGILHAVRYSRWAWKGRSFSFLLRQSKAFDSLLISSLRNAYTRGFSVELAKFNKRNANISY